MQQAILIIFVFFGTSLAITPPKRYRDYEYNRYTGAFYKLYIESLEGKVANAKCVNEGAQLMVPSSLEDIAQLYGMLKRFPNIGNLVFVGSSLALSPRISKKYRDYEYNRKTNAFYKLHFEEKEGNVAKGICQYEGAQLMIPSNKEDMTQLHKMLKQFPDIGDLVFVGNDGQNHESAEDVNIVTLEPSIVEPSSSEANQEDDRSSCEVYNKRRDDYETTPCQHYHPFICKVEAKDAPYDEQCDVYANDYKYYDNVKSCYKTPQKRYTWDEAYSVCRAENAHLVVLNSKAESETVKEFLKTAPKPTFFLFAGIRANRPTDGTTRVFRTIFNQTLEEASFNEWSDGEPNNYQGSEYCGSIFSENGKYNDVDCSQYNGFICEKEV